MTDRATVASASLRIAVVHPSRVARVQMTLALERLGHAVVAAGASVEAVRTPAADVVIIDGRLAELADRIAAIRDDRPSMRILVLASLEEIALVRTAVAAGASGAIRRPPLASRLAEALARLASADPEV